jgi:TRAP-type C4-dicarboxylate transport system permease small subunit
MHGLQRLNRFLNTIEKICVFGGGIAMMLMMLLTTADLLSRKFLDYSFPSLYEFTEDYLMVGLVFLTVSYVYIQGGHVRVTLLEHMIPTRFLRPWTKLHQAMALILFALVAVKGWEAAMRAWEFNEMSNSAMPYPLAPSLLMVPIGCSLLCLRLAQALFGLVQIEDPHDLSDAS